MDTAEIPIPPITETENSSFTWPSLVSQKPETIFVTDENPPPPELATILPHQTKKLFFFTGFFLAYDESDQVLGVVTKTNRDYDANGQPTNSKLTLEFNSDYSQSLEQEFAHSPTFDNWQQALSSLPNFLKSDGLYYQLKPENFPPHHQISLNLLMQLQHLLTSYPEKRPEVQNILGKVGYLAPELLLHIDTPEEISSLSSAVALLPPDKLSTIVGSMSSINALSWSDIPWEDDEGRIKPGFKAYQAFSSRITQELLLEMISDPNLADELIQDTYTLAFKSLAAIGYLASDPLSAQEIFANQDQRSQESVAHSYAKLLKDNKAKSALALVPIAMYWIQELTSPEGMSPESTAYFYQALSNLNALANTTTADTKQETTLISRHLDELGLLRDFKWLDAGSGDGSRVLRPLIEHVRSMGKQPDVHAVDLLSFPHPNDGAWTPHQGDITSAEILQLFGSTKFDLITLTWSVFNDLSGIQRLQALENFNQLLKDGGCLLLDVTVDYEQEEAIYRAANPNTLPGSFERSFPGPDQEDISKPFVATRSAAMQGELAQSGFKITSQIEYTTANGYKRMLAIAQKTNQPLPRPPEPWQTPAEAMT